MAVMRSVILAVLAACWTGSPPPQQPPEPAPAPAPEPAPAATVRSSQPPAAARRARIIQVTVVESHNARVRGGRCYGPRCGPNRVSIKTVVTIAAGRSSGVTTSWKAVLADGNGRLVPNGDITLTRIDRNSSVGTVDVPAAAIRPSTYAYLLP